MAFCFHFFFFLSKALKLKRKENVLLTATKDDDG